MFPNPCLPHVMKIHMQRYALESSDVLSLSRRSPYQLMTIIAYPTDESEGLRLRQCHSHRQGHAPLSRRATVRHHEAVMWYPPTGDSTLSLTFILLVTEIN